MSHDDFRELPNRRSDREEDSDIKTDDGMEQSKYRYTASSTNSNHNSMTRISTAATSVTSQTSLSSSSPTASTMATNKPRRPLYEQALDQHLQDQQSIAMGRLERLASIRRGDSHSPTRSYDPINGVGRHKLGPASPISPTFRNGWSPKAPFPLSPVEDTSGSVLAPSKPPDFDKFDFGIPSRSPITPPMTSKEIEFPNSDQKWERHPSPASLNIPDVLDSQSSRMMRDELSAKSSDSQDMRSTPLSSCTSSSRSSMDQSLVIRHIGEELDHAARDIHNTSSGSKHRNPLSISVTHDISEPGSPVLAPSPVSPISDEPPSKHFPETYKPHSQPPSPRFPPTTNDSSTLLPGQGLSLLVRQHLRSDSGSSSIYAGSTYTRLSRVSRHGVAASIIKPNAEPRQSGSSAGNIWQYDEFEGENLQDVPDSPSSVYPPGSIASPKFPPPLPQKAVIEHDDPNTSFRVENDDKKADDLWDRTVGGPSDRDDDDRDWEEKLAFRRQLIQQNLRNQGRITEMPSSETMKDSIGKSAPANAQPTGMLKSKSSTGFIGNEDEDPRLQHPATRVPPFNQSQPRPRPALTTNQTSSTEDCFGPDAASLAGQPKHSPSFSGRPDTNPSQDQLSGNSISGDKPKGQPMGWRDPWDGATGSPSQPTPPGPSRSRRGRPQPQPLQDGYKDDLSRAMGTGQSTIIEMPAQRMRGKSSPAERLENVKSTFEEEDHRRSTFRRPRGNSAASNYASTLTQLSTTGPLSRAASVASANGVSTSATPGSGASPSPLNRTPSEVIQQIHDANSVLVPAKKRVINKSQIGEPKLITKTSSIPTINLPARKPSDTVHSIGNLESARGRKRTNTIFGGLGKAKPTDDIPEAPNETDHDMEKLKKGHVKLRKSTSDGGALGSRARMDDMARMREQMPSQSLTHGNSVPPQLAGNMI